VLFRSWNAQARIHDDFCPHGNWLFLPWHRAYLLYFENICRELTGVADFALPYWNWTAQPKIPSAFWGPNNALANSTRQAKPNSIARPSSVGAPVIAGIMNETNFGAFASGSIPLNVDQRTGASYGLLEGTPHNYIHGFVGGDMLTLMSPLDPLFWCHHNNVERLWVKWNLDGNPNTNDPDWHDRVFTEFASRNGSPVTISVSDTLFWPHFAYRYDDQPVFLVERGDGGPREQQASDARARELFQEGADVRLDVMERVRLAQSVGVALDDPLTLSPDVRIPTPAENAVEGVEQIGRAHV